MKLVLRLTILAILAIASPAQATTYNRYEDVVRNTSGRAVAGAAIYVYVADTDSLANLYLTKDGLTSTTNPVYSDSAGRFYFYATAGLYDLTVSRSGIDTHTFKDVWVGLISQGDVAFDGNVAFGDSISIAGGVSGRVHIAGNVTTGGSIISTGLIYAGQAVIAGGPFSSNDSTLSLVNKLTVVRGRGSPEGVLAANAGTIYLRTDGGTGTSFYVKETASGNTGWVAK